MPTFKLTTAYSAGPPVAGRYDVRALLAAGDVAGNLYPNLLYAYEFTIQADKNNPGSIFVGDSHLTPTNFSTELQPGDSMSESSGLQSASIDDYLCMDVIQAAPTAPTAATGAGGTNLLTAGAYRWKITFVTADGETEAGTASNSITVDPATQLPPALSAIPTGGTSVTARKVYRTVAGGSVYKLSGTISNNTATTYTDNVADASLGATAPTTNTAIPMRVNIFWESTFPLGMV